MGGKGGKGEGQFGILGAPPSPIVEEEEEEKKEKKKEKKKKKEERTPGINLTTPT